MSVGRAMAEPILPPYVEAAIAVLHWTIVNCGNTHGFFSYVAEVLDDSFTQYLPHNVQLAFTSSNLDDGSVVDIDGSDGEENMNGFGGVSSDDATHDEPRVRNISIRTRV